MITLNGKFVVVAGGTGNVGSYVIRALLDAGARVAVPSRSDSKLDELRTYLAAHGVAQTQNLLPVVGDIGTEAGAARVRAEIAQNAGDPDAVVASLGAFRPADSIAAATTEALNQVLHDYLIAHFTAAKAFVPAVAAKNGTYVFINGPLAFELWPGSSLVSVATAAQHMLFRACAQEQEHSAVNVIELVNHAFIRNRETQPESTVSGEAVGRAIVDLVAGSAKAHRGTSLHVDSEEAPSRHD